MLPRERVLTSLSHVRPDRVPTDFWAVPEVWRRLMEYYGLSSREAVLDKLEIDIRAFSPDYMGQSKELLPDGTFYAEDGTHRRSVSNNFSAYDEYAAFPLEACATPEEVHAYSRWPKTHMWDWAGFSKKIGDAHKTHFVKVEVGGPFELGWGLRGYQRMLLDMVEEPEIFHAIMEERTGFYIDYVHKAMGAAGEKIDAFYTYDDIAVQNSLLISKNMWEEFIRPYHVRLNAAIKAYGKFIIYHSCGAVVPMIDSLAALPIDVLNPLQPKAAGMDFDMIKARWGDKLCFHGAICIQELLPHATPEKVYETASQTIRVLGRDGGYILTAAHNIQNDTPTENILAIYRAAKDSANW